MIKNSLINFTNISDFGPTQAAFLLGQNNFDAFFTVF